MSFGRATEISYTGMDRYFDMLFAIATEGRLQTLKKGRG